MGTKPGLRPGLYERPLQGREFHTVWCRSMHSAERLRKIQEPTRTDAPSFENDAEFRV